MSEVTRILNAMEFGEAGAAEELLPAVYDELRRLAASKMAREKPGQTLQATALVHEAWIKLAGSDNQAWNSRAHFLGAAAEAMRRILVDNARRKARLKRGANPREVLIDEVAEHEIATCASSDEVLLVHDALDELARTDPIAAQVVKLRYFVGLSYSDIAATLRLTERTVFRYWAFARSWLKGAVRQGRDA